MFDIAAIIINYNTSKYTIQCIESIYKNTCADLLFQIIVVDNCSEKEDFLLLKNYCTNSNFPNLELHHSSVNTGFGGGNMFGVQFAKAKHYAFINNDAVLLNDCFSILHTQIKNNPLIGVCGPKNYNSKGKFLSTIDHFASLPKEILGRKYLEFVNPKKYPKRRFPFENIQRCQLISGSFMFMRATDFHKIGGFDTNIFLYHEETDLCLRLYKQKKYAFFIPEANIIHHHGASSKKSIQMKTEIKISLLYVIRKHYGRFQHRILLTYLQVFYFFKILFKPKNRHLLNVLIKGGGLEFSLKQQQLKKMIDV